MEKDKRIELDLVVKSLLHEFERKKHSELEVWYVLAKTLSDYVSKSYGENEWRVAMRKFTRNMMEYHAVVKEVERVVKKKGLVEKLGDLKKAMTGEEVDD